MTDPQPDDDDTPRLPAEIEQLLRGLTGGEIDPQLASMMQGMGLDKVDPQMLAMVMGQVQAMFSAPESDTAVNAVLATDIARKTVAAEGDELASAADRPGRGRGRAGGRHVAGCRHRPHHPRPHRRRVEPGRVGRGDDAGVDRPRRAGGRRRHRRRRRRARGPAGPARASSARPGCPTGMLDQAGPMLRRMHGSMFSMQLGQGTGTLAGEVLTGCEVSLPLVPAPTVVLMPAAVREFAAGPRGRRAAGPALPRRARGRPGAAVRCRAVARPGPAGRGARLRGRHQHRHQRASRRRSARSTPPTPRPCSRRCRAGCSRPQPSPAQQAALARLETLLALVEGWVDVVADRATREHLPQADALGEAVRRRRATGGPAEKAFGALVGPRAATPPAARRREPVRGARGLRRPGRPRRRVAPPRPRAEHRRPRRPAGLRRAHRAARRPTTWMPRSTACCAARTTRDGCRPGSGGAVPPRPRPGRGGGVRGPARRRRGGADRLGGAGRRPGPAAARLPRPPRGPPRRRGEGGAAGAPHGILPRARPGRRARAAHPAPQGERRGSSSAGTSRSGTPSCGRRPAARPARSPASTPLEPLPRPGAARPAHARRVASARCREHLDVRYAAVAPAGASGAGQRGVARRAVVAGRRPARGHPRRARPAGVTRSRRPRARLTRRRRAAGPTSRVVVDLGRQALGVGQPVEEAAGPLQARVRREQAPEGRPVAGHEQVGELVEQHVVEHVVGHVAQPVGDPDGALGGGARGPAPAHRRHPPHARRAGVAAEVAARELARRARPGPRRRTAGAARRR